ncbi:MAG: NAD kinase [Mycobacteriales bacterium]
MTRTALLVTHTGRADVIQLARRVAEELRAAGFDLRVLEDEADDLAIRIADTVTAEEPKNRPDLAPEIAIVLGGDGTILRAAEIVRPLGVPLLGVNLGRVGFLAGTEPGDVDEMVSRVVTRDYAVTERMTVEIDVAAPDGSHTSCWAMNEASLEKSRRGRVIDVTLSVDGHALTAFGCDGVICSTPIGSTAYAFSAGGPVVWPDVEALLVVPSNAHALFARPLLVAPTAVVSLDIGAVGYGGLLICDGRRSTNVEPGSRLVLRRGAHEVRVASFDGGPFTDRLVDRFRLPVLGFRDHRLPAPDGSSEVDA